jgi:hypothetical protein
MVTGVVPQGWAELVAWMQERSAAGKLDPEAAWQHYRGLAIASKHAGLGELAVRFRAAPAKDRLALVGTIASLLAPVEWPEAWDDARRRLVDALGQLALVIGDSAIDLGADEELYRAGLSTLSVARDLLRTPCRRDEMRAVARLCALGNAWCSRAVGRSFDVRGPRTADEQVATAQRQYAMAFATYAEAARAMNTACGAVLFTGLELDLPRRGAA